MSKKQPKRVMQYKGPDGSSVFDPSTEFLDRVITEGRDVDWRRGSGDSGLAVVEKINQKALRGLDEEPALVFFLVERHGFFFSFFEPHARGSAWVTYAGGECRPWVEHFVGGLEMYVPRACFVSRTAALEIVREFVSTRQRPTSVRWIKQSELDFPLAEERRFAPGELA